MIYSSSTDRYRDGDNESTSNRRKIDISNETSISQNDTDSILSYNNSYTIGEQYPQTLDRRIQSKAVAEKEEKRIDQVVHKSIEELSAAYYKGVISGHLSEEIEEKIIQIEYCHSMRILGEVLQKTVYKNFANESFLVSIGDALLRYSFREVDPWGVAIVSWFVGHPSDEVKVCAVQLIDNWNDKELLYFLDNIEIKAEWLKTYIFSIIGNKRDVLL